MNIRTTVTGVALLAGALAVASPALANDRLHEDDFSSGTGDWVEYEAAVTNDAGTLRVSATPGDQDGAYSYFGGIASPTGTERTTPLGDGYIAELDVYLDPEALQVGEGFDLSVAASNVHTGLHLRDFIFHVGKISDGRLLVNGSNNTDFITNEFKLTNDNGGNYHVVTVAGWYTLQHVFGTAADGVSLAVDLNLIDANGTTLWTATRNNPIDLVTDVGGARYQWLTHVDGSFRFDNQSLERVTATPEAADDCKKGGYEAYGFKNQGQCLASVVANGNANH